MFNVERSFTLAVLVFMFIAILYGIRRSKSGKDVTIRPFRDL